MSELPDELSEWLALPYTRCFRALVDEKRFLTLAEAGLGSVQRKPEIMRMISPGSLREVEARAIREAEHDAEWVKAEADRDFPMLRAHASVSVWSILEVFAEDLAVAWLLNRSDAWNGDSIQKVKVSIGTFESLDREGRARYAISEIQKNERADVKGGIAPLKLILERLKIAPKLGDQTQKALHELRQVRNAIVHLGGRADQRLREACTDVPWPLGQRITISEDLFEWYFSGALSFANQVTLKAGIVLGEFKPEDSNMGDIDSRPG
jgi:hypothetical protein